MWRNQGRMSLQWRHNERHGVWNHQLNDCLLKRLFMRRSTKTSKLRVTRLCEGNSLMTAEFPAQRASNFSIWWRHHAILLMVKPSAECIRYQTISLNRKKTLYLDHHYLITLIFVHVYTVGGLTNWGYVLEYKPRSTVRSCSLNERPHCLFLAESSRCVLKTISIQSIRCLHNWDIHGLSYHFNRTATDVYDHRGEQGYVHFPHYDIIHGENILKERFVLVLCLSKIIEINITGCNKKYMTISGMND